MPDVKVFSYLCCIEIFHLQNSQTVKEHEL